MLKNYFFLFNIHNFLVIKTQLNANWAGVFSLSPSGRILSFNIVCICLTEACMWRFYGKIAKVDIMSGNQRKNSQRTLVLLGT